MIAAIILTYIHNGLLTFSHYFQLAYIIYIQFIPLYSCLKVVQILGNKKMKYNLSCVLSFHLEFVKVQFSGNYPN